jgi:hypothetical protein
MASWARALAWSKSSFATSLTLLVTRSDMAATGNRIKVEMLGIRYGERTNTMDDERHQGGGAHVCQVAPTSLLRPLAPAPFAPKLHSAAARARERTGKVHLSTQCLQTPLGTVERYVPPPGSSRHRDAICNKNRTWGAGYVTARHAKISAPAFGIKNTKRWQRQTEVPIIRHRAPFFPTYPPV